MTLTRASVRRGARSVLRAISWSVRPGEHWLLSGHNGAGKTQLLKLLAGDVWPVRRAQRTYCRRGQPSADPREVKAEIAYVGSERQDRYEHYGWNHRVEAVVGTGRYRTDIPLDRLDQSDRRAIGRALRSLGIETLARRRMLTLSYGERRLVLLARALASRPKLLLLDEPFNGLDATHRERLLACLRRLRRRALPWVLSTHRAADVPPGITHWLELREGRIWRRGRLSARRSRSAPPERGPPAHVGAPMRLDPPIITLERASVWREGRCVLRQVSLSIRPGQCWVVHGHNGSGKSTLLQLLYGGLGAARGGRVVRAGLAPGVPLSQFQQTVGFVGAERQVGVPLRERALLARSYGQVRERVWREALDRPRRLLLLDEPYAGLDARRRARRQQQVERALARGTAVVLATHELSDWPAGSTHELALAHGRVRYAGERRQRGRQR